jgi:hypothetical protein
MNLGGRALSRIKHDNVKFTRKGGAGLQRDNNLAEKIQREWTLCIFLVFLETHPPQAVRGRCGFIKIKIAETCAKI